MASLVDPFQLRMHLKSRPKIGLNAAPFIDLLLIGLVLVINGSPFIGAPGISVDLVRIPQQEVRESIADAVLTIDRNELIFFQGLKIPYSQIQPELSGFLAKHPSENAVLMVKADVGMDMRQLFDVFEIAREAGFARVHLAAEVLWE